MKITKKQLRKIIKEELKMVLKESWDEPGFTWQTVDPAKYAAGPTVMPGKEELLNRLWNALRGEEGPEEEETGRFYNPDTGEWEERPSDPSKEWEFNHDTQEWEPPEGK
jgi:hypothetical protein